MLTLRQRLFIIISIIAGLIIAIVLGIFVYRKWQNQSGSIMTPVQPTVLITDTAPSVNNAQPVQPIVGKQTALLPLPTNPEEIYLRQLATIFVERFASYSNQNDNKHIDDTIALATPSLQKWMKSQTQVASLTYAGVTTEVMSAAIKSKTTDKAIIEIGARQVVVENGATKTVQKKAEVTLEKMSGEWKVGALYWKVY